MGDNLPGILINRKPHNNRTGIVIDVPRRAAADGDPSAFDLQNVLPYAIVRVGEQLERLFQSLMAKEGLSVRQFGILAQFATTDAMTAAELARRLGVTPQSVAPQIDALDGQGLLSRTPIPGRGRPVELRLTTKGRATVRRVLGVAMAEQERLSSHMTTAERDTLMAQIAEIGRRAEDG
jgi:DNA-binding MarR family transcriptional regulator